MCTFTWVLVPLGARCMHFPGVGVNWLLWVLGTESESSVKAVCILNCWVLSLALSFNSLRQTHYVDQLALNSQKSTHLLSLSTGIISMCSHICFECWESNPELQVFKTNILLSLASECEFLKFVLLLCIWCIRCTGWEWGYKYHNVSIEIKGQLSGTTLGSRTQLGWLSLWALPTEPPCQPRVWGLWLRAFSENQWFRSIGFHLKRWSSTLGKYNTAHRRMPDPFPPERTKVKK